MGSSSSTSVSETSNVINTYAQNFSANCGSSSSSNNAVLITGSGNSLENIIQSSSTGSDQKCKVYNPQTASSAATLTMSAAAISATIAQQATGLLDDSKSSASTNISTTLANTINQNTIFNCAISVTSSNLVLVDGSGNVLKNVDQYSTTNAVSSCLMNSSQSASVLGNVAQTSSATASDTIQSILQPFATMLQGIMVDMVVATVAFVIFVVLIVIVYKMLGPEKKHRVIAQQLTKTT